MTTVHDGVNTSNRGILNTKAQAGPVATNANRKAGRAFDASDFLLTVDATAALPAGCVYVGGIAYTADGRMCTTTAAPALTGTRVSGVAIRNDGAVHIATATGTRFTRHAGRSITALGQLVVISN